MTCQLTIAVYSQSSDLASLSSRQVNRLKTQAKTSKIDDISFQGAAQFFGVADDNQSTSELLLRDAIRFEKLLEYRLRIIRLR